MIKDSPLAVDNPSIIQTESAAIQNVPHFQFQSRRYIIKSRSIHEGLDINSVLMYVDMSLSVIYITQGQLLSKNIFI